MVSAFAVVVRIAFVLMQTGCVPVNKYLESAALC